MTSMHTARPAGEACPNCGAALVAAEPRRRVQLVDLMIVVCGVALAFGLIRAAAAGAAGQAPLWATAIAATLGCLVAATPTLLLLRLRQPRPPLRRLAREPGFAANLAATAVLAIGLLAIGILGTVRVAKHSQTLLAGRAVRTPDPDWWAGVVFQVIMVVGPAVIGAWLLLLVSGRRRPRRGWLDPIGRVVGTLWIVVFIIHCVAQLARFAG